MLEEATSTTRQNGGPGGRHLQQFSQMPSSTGKAFLFYQWPSFVTKICGYLGA
jgi:hypothetical protein